MSDRAIHLKDGVSLVGMQPEAIYGIDICSQVFHEHELNFTLTSCRDGTHMRHSHHYKGIAWDIRVWELAGRIEWMCKQLRERLGKDYEVFDEHDHIHVEYDPEDLDG